MFEAFILAGGRSSRMGRDKASISFLGKPLMLHVADALRTAEATKVSIVLSSQSEASDLAGQPAISDTYVGAGALAGIHAALKASKSRITFVSACDLPFASAELIKRLVFLCEKSECAVPIQSDGRSQPLFAAYRTEPALIASETILKEKNRSNAAGALTDCLRTSFLAYEDYSDLPRASLLLTNVNTPEELIHAEREGNLLSETDDTDRI